MPSRTTLLSAALAALTVCSSTYAEPWTESGYAATAVEVARTVRASVDTRLNAHMTQPRNDGGALWFDLAATHDTLDVMQADQGYESDVWAGKLGADISKGDAFFGVVYTYAYAESEAQNRPTALTSESDWFGVHAFGERRFGDFAVAGTLGWMHAHGDIESPGRVASMHTNMFTADIAARVLFDVAGVNVLPYAKVEATWLLPRHYSGYEPENALLYQFPVGVNLSRTFEWAGWSVQPVLDLAAIASAGDTRISEQNTDMAWVGEHTLYRAQAQLTAQSEHTRLALSYGYLAAHSGRKAHTVDVRAQYVF